MYFEKQRNTDDDEQIHNKSKQDYGKDASNSRILTTRLTISENHGVKLHGSNTKTSTTLLTIPAGGSIELQQAVEIGDALPFNYCLTLFLSIPDVNRERFPLRRIQETMHSVIVEAGWTFNEQASVLLVTNCAVPSSVIHTWKSFLEALHLQVDVFNLSLYHSFFHDQSLTRTIFKQYAGKHIVLFCDRFQFVGHEADVFDFLVPSFLTEDVASAETSMVFVGALRESPAADARLKTWLRAYLSPILSTQRSIKYASPENFVSAMQEQSRRHIQVDEIATYSVALPAHCRRSMDPVPAHDLDGIAQNLKQRLPNFCLTITEGKSSLHEEGGNSIQQNSLSILKIPRYQRVWITAPMNIISTMMSIGTGIPKSDLYGFIASLSVKARFQIISQEIRTHATATVFDQYSDNAKAAVLSLSYTTQIEIVTMAQLLTTNKTIDKIEDIDLVLSYFTLSNQIIEFLQNTSDPTFTRPPVSEPIYDILRGTIGKIDELFRSGTFFKRLRPGGDRSLATTFTDNVIRSIGHILSSTQKAQLRDRSLIRKYSSDANSSIELKLATWLQLATVDLKRVLLWIPSLCRDLDGKDYLSMDDVTKAKKSHDLVVASVRKHRLLMTELDPILEEELQANRRKQVQKK